MGLEIDISPGAILVMIFFALMGIVYFKRGRTAGPASHMIYGVALMIFPYFVSEFLPMVVVGLGIWALAWFVRFG